MLFLGVSLVVVLLAAMSLWSDLTSRNDFANNRPHIDSLRDITGIIDRNELVARFGVPNVQLRFQTNLETALANRRPVMKWLGTEGDVATIIAVLAAQILQQPAAWLLVGLAGVYCVASWIVSFALIWPHHRQFDDEV